MKNYFEALRIQEKLDDPGTEAYILSNIGLIYSNQKLDDKALVYQNKSPKIRRKLNDMHGLSASLSNIAIIYLRQEKFKKAIDNYLECVRISKDLDDERGIADAYNNVAIVYMRAKDYDKSEEYLFKCLEIRLELNDPLGLADTYGNIGTFYSAKRDYVKAREYFLMAVPIVKKIGSKEALSYMYEHLSDVEDSLLNPSAAYDFYKLHIIYRDSDQNSEVVRAQTEHELQYKFDKEKEVTRLNQEKKEEQARIILYAVCSGLLIILIFSIMLFRRWKETQGQKRTIEERNKLVELKNEEILDSISYA
ncbi:MAG: tetratricopeptide (TPR) repeat protein, partial [Crocinitomicaceae bacterium]